MTVTSKPPVLVVVQLSGGNDFLNTLVPYTSEHYYDARPTVVIPQDEVLPINDELAFNPQHGAAQGRIRQRQDGDRPGHRIRQLQPIPLQGDGHLAHL